jgi:hypothetical protein
MIKARFAPSPPLALDTTLARLGHAYEDPGYRDLDGLAAGFSLDHLAP